jgi:hypothetical protein
MMRQQGNVWSHIDTKAQPRHAVRRPCCSVADVPIGGGALFWGGHFDEATKTEALRTMRHAAQDAQIAVEVKAHTVEMGLGEDVCMTYLPIPNRYVMHPTSPRAHTFTPSGA